MWPSIYIQSTAQAYFFLQHFYFYLFRYLCYVNVWIRVSASNLWLSRMIQEPNWSTKVQIVKSYSVWNKCMIISAVSHPDNWLCPVANVNKGPNMERVNAKYTWVHWFPQMLRTWKKFHQHAHFMSNLFKLNETSWR